MTLFAEKQVFKLLGLEAIQPSPLHTSQDCTICTKPLAMLPGPAHEENSLSKFHAAVRITACGHVVGEECLDAWLDTSHRCPICKRELFEARGDAITYEDIERVFQLLSRHHGIYRVRESISRVMKRNGGRYIPQQLARGGSTRDEQIEEDDFGYAGEEFWSSEEEVESDEEEDGEEDGDEDMEVDEDEGDGENTGLDEQGASEDEGSEESDDEGQEEKETHMTEIEE